MHSAEPELDHEVSALGRFGGLAKREVAPGSMMAAMQDLDAFANLSPTSLADVLERDRVMDIGIRPLWPGAPRIAGQAYLS